MQFDLRPHEIEYFPFRFQRILSTTKSESSSIHYPYEDQFNLNSNDGENSNRDSIKPNEMKIDAKL